MQHKIIPGFISICNLTGKFQNSKNTLTTRGSLFYWVAFPMPLFFAFASCLTPKEDHMEAKASLDLIKINNKGVSYVDDKDQSEVSGNIGFLISEGFVYGKGAPNVLKTPRQKEGVFGVAAVNVDNNSFLSSSYTPEKTTMTGSFYLSEGLDFVNKASNESQGNFTTKVSLYYLQVPVLINYNHPINESNSIHFGLGPYAAIGLFGNYKSSGISRSVKFGSSTNSDDLKRMDYGLAFNAGFRFLKKWDASLNYDLGLRNVSTTPPDPDTKIRGFSLNVGYWFK
jgi:hypothetical protein